ncbi:MULTISPECIES: carbohydrate ABC transporter permease [Thermoanaerobacterium]|uniref:ABC transporter n=2 Tax=Thermoanaerobacterium TaxID=28895 RepID=W9ECB9_9THEO|nr:MULTISPECIES: sugar ABC transporter permease [Thermoanaerobacterium]AFK87094.1 ABC-type transporter, integral membrane subunit [Thermoanaerobacterium saccharolyticum JW/SL-YS485]ETO38876.1 ABC transporter [Thermoanaerobacterium aotearoense SCUT27]
MERTESIANFSNAIEDSELKNDVIRFKNNIEPYLYLFPSAIVFATFVFYPFIKTIYISLFLTDPQGNLAKFIGLQNYIDIFKTADYINSIYLTLKFVIMTVPLEMIVAFVLSIFANLRLKGIEVIKTIYTLPIAISSASAAVIWMLLFNPSIGFINYILSFFGIHGIGWLTDVKYGMISVSIVNIWLNVGINFIFMLAGLKSIPKDLYESAQIDGANIFVQHIKITVPMLSPTLFFLITVDVINAFQEFGVINIMTQGGPVNSTNVMVYSIYRDAFFNFRYGNGAAESIIIFILLLIFTLLQFASSEKKVFYK